MLPFQKRKNAGEGTLSGSGHALGPEDVELLETPLALPEGGRRRGLEASTGPSLSSFSASTFSASTAAPGNGGRPRGRTLTARKILDEQLEGQVAGALLASFAEGRESSHVRRAPARPTARPLSQPPPLPPRALGRSNPPPPVPAPVPVSSPPFVRRSSPFLTSELARPAASMPGGPLGVGPVAPPSAASASVPPVSLPQALAQERPEPTIIVVRERPRLAWVLGAALLGAVSALAAVRITMSPSFRAATSSPVVAAPVAEPPAAGGPDGTAVVVAPSVVTPASVAAAAAVSSSSLGSGAPASATESASASASGSSSGPVMRFADEEGVAIFTTPSSPHPHARVRSPGSSSSPGSLASPAPAKASGGAGSAPGSTLPDGSLTLGGPRAAPGPAPVAAPPTPEPPAPEPPKKRVLTPEQQLAEAQLKASMK